MHILYKVTYLPHLETEYPKYYIGSKYNYKGNYYGSVDSKQVYSYTLGKSLRDWWKEQKQQPHNFLFEVVECFEEITPEELVIQERDLQLKLNVLSEQYFNHSIATKGFCSKKRSEESKNHISKKTKEYWESDAGNLKKQRLVDRNKSFQSEWMKQKWKNPSDAQLSAIHHLIKPKTQEHKIKLKQSKLTDIEYKGVIYKGWESLLELTGVSKHLYKKYYLNGYEPEVNIANNHNPKLIPLENI